MVKYKTNKQVLKEVSNISVVGESFIIQALQYYSDQILKDGLASWGDRSFISKELWLDQAEQTKEVLEKAYG
jgi:hypothetical protein